MLYDAKFGQNKVIQTARIFDSAFYPRNMNHVSALVHASTLPSNKSTINEELDSEGRTKASEGSLLILNSKCATMSPNDDSIFSENSEGVQHNSRDFNSVKVKVTIKYTRLSMSRFDSL